MCSGYFIKNKDVGVGVINDFLSRYRHHLVPLLFHEVTSLHLFYLREIIVSLVPLILFHLGQSPNKNEMYRQQPQRRQERRLLIN